ncbi:hypothetical protein HJG60_008416 [Phyllostomus discolor]|uniref:Uncharacterized protein n=1 Tax=Phyllostomus discolor TaxID=89673 RepID=A0A833Z044_9CHIR|nr:hypothetical protein HJG60_008416 [Phyllostomus discolor]
MTWELVRQECSLSRQCPQPVVSQAAGVQSSLKRRVNVGTGTQGGALPALPDVNFSVLGSPHGVGSPWLGSERSQTPHGAPREPQTSPAVRLESRLKNAESEMRPPQVPASEPVFLGRSLHPQGLGVCTPSCHTGCRCCPSGLDLGTQGAGEAPPAVRLANAAPSARRQRKRPPLCINSCLCPGRLVLREMLSSQGQTVSTAASPSAWRGAQPGPGTRGTVDASSMHQPGARRAPPPGGERSCWGRLPPPGASPEPEPHFSHEAPPG